jgi:outer membrane biosynthesis protein TonB
MGMTAQDELLKRYHEANEHDPARPGAALRENVLAQARASAGKHTAPGAGRPEAANEAAWRWRALGGLAVLGLAALVVLQFDRGTPDERELALGQPSTSPAAPQAKSPAPAYPAPATADPSMASREAAPPAKAQPVPAPPVATPRTRPAPAPVPAEAPTPPPPAVAESTAPAAVGTAQSAQDADTRAREATGIAAAPRDRALERCEPVLAPRHTCACSSARGGPAGRSRTWRSRRGARCARARRRRERQRPAGSDRTHARRTAR